MWTQFYLENLHFSINLFTALVFFAVFWLYFDAWLGKKTLRDGLKFLGFFLLSVSLLIHGTQIELKIIESSGNGTFFHFLSLTLRVIGYFAIIASQLIDPLLPKPVTTGIGPAPLAGAAFGSLKPVAFLQVPGPFLALLTGILYLRRATTGLERHLKAVAVSFFLFTAAETLSLRELFGSTNNVDLYNLVKTFGILWFIEHLVLLLAAVILGKWVFGYLLKRIQSQLFMFFTMAIVAIFLLTTVSFTALLLNNLAEESLNQLKTNVKVLNLAIDSKKDQAYSDAQVVVQNPQVMTAVLARDKNFLATFSTQFLLSKKQSFLLIMDENGQVLARGEDNQRIGSSLSDDTLVKRSLLGSGGSSVISKTGVMNIPQIYVRASAPIKSSGRTIGAVLTGVVLDNAFVDGVKKATNLETSIYGADHLSASTLVGSDGKSRPLGISEGNKKVKETVLKKGEPFSGQVTILNVSYFAAYLPLKDIDNNLVGMLFVGSRQVGILQAAGKSIELTFLVTVLLLVLSIVPAYLIARSISKQMK